MEEVLKLILDKLNSMDSDIKDVKGELKDLKKHVLIIENDHGKKLDSLFDGYKQVYEKVSTVEEKVDSLSSKVEKQDVEIRVIRGAR